MVAAKKILIVEDEQVVAEHLQRSLSSIGYEVIGIASSGEDAVRMGEQGRPDLVVTDIVLRGELDGISAAQELQPLGIPVVYLTAYSDRHLLDRAQHTEPLAYIIKPAKSGELAAVIQLALFKREQEQERDRLDEAHAAASREAEEQFRLMVAGVTDFAIFTLDSEGRVNSWNHGAERINGYRASQIMGQSFEVLFTREDRARDVPRSELEMARRMGTADNTRWLVRRDGERYWAEGVINAIRDSTGELTGFTKVVRDATRQKLIQDALHRTQEKLRIALQAARMGTWEWDVETNTETFDDNLRSLFGLPPEHRIRTIEDVYAMVHPDDLDEVTGTVQRALREGGHLISEFRVRRPDGSVRWLMAQGEVLTGRHGRPELVTGACIDITERKQAEAMLRESEERFRLFVHNIRDYALFQLDPAGRVVAWNAGAERMLGYTEAEILGQPADVLFAAEARGEGEPRRQLTKAARTGGAEDEGWRVRRDGARFWCSGVVTRITDEQGRLRGFAQVLRDETERRQSKEQLTASLAEKESLLKEIHHRVKNNLQVITSLLSLQSDSVTDLTVRELFEESINRVRTIADIHDLLYRSPELSGIDANLYFTRLAANLVSFYGLDHGRVRVRVEAQRASLDLARAIPCGLIVNELLTNALKHGYPGSKGGEIRVALTTEDGSWILQVSDDGVGFPPGITSLDAASLGLKLVSVLTRQLQGTVNLRSGPGAQVTIRFPLSLQDGGAPT